MFHMPIINMFIGQKYFFFPFSFFFFEVAGDSFVIHPKSEKLDREWKLFVYANKKKKKTIWKLNKFETEIPTCVIVMAVPFRRSYNFVFFSLFLFSFIQRYEIHSIVFISIQMSGKRVLAKTTWTNNVAKNEKTRVRYLQAMAKVKIGTDKRKFRNWHCKKNEKKKKIKERKSSRFSLYQF